MDKNFTKDYAKLCKVFNVPELSYLSEFIEDNYNLNNYFSITEFVHWVRDNNLFSKTPDEIIVLWKLENST